MLGYSAIHAREFPSCYGNNQCMYHGSQLHAILSMFGCCGVPMLTGAPGSCTSEAAECALSMFGAHETHSCNNQTTPSYLFNAASKTTIPICVDDVSEKAADSWEELIIDAYNGSGRGTRMYGIEIFCTLPILSVNWKVGMDRPRAHSRVIQIAFQQHEDEPEANLFFAEMAYCRDNVSRSVGELIRLSQHFEPPETKHQPLHLSSSRTTLKPIWSASKIYNNHVNIHVLFS